jgi:hypothetical protein
VSSTKQAMRQDAHCPVVDRTVALSWLRVSLPGTSLVEAAKKSCSNVESCLAKYSRLENVPACLLHALR